MERFCETNKMDTIVPNLRESVEKIKVPYRFNLIKMRNYCEVCDTFLKNIKLHLKTLKHERNKNKFIFNHLPCEKGIKKHVCIYCKKKSRQYKSSFKQ